MLIHVVFTFSLLGMPKIKTRKTKFIKIIYDLVSLQCRRILRGRNLACVRNIVVAAIFDFMTV